MVQAASQAKAAAPTSILVEEKYIHKDNLSQRLIQSKLDTSDSDETLRCITPIFYSLADLYNKASLKLENLEKDVVLLRKT